VERLDSVSRRAEFLHQTFCVRSDRLAFLRELPPPLAQHRLACWTAEYLVGDLTSDRRP
jgi:hypothetical protein